MPEGYVEINGQLVKKPAKGRCAYCGSDMLEFYDDGSGICLNCGRTFSWLKPLKDPVNPQVKSEPKRSPPPVVAPPPRKTPVQPAPAPKKGILSARTISILGLLAALLIGLGAITLIATMNMGSWPPDDYDRDTIGNIVKAGMMLWATGTMLFLMAGFSAAATDELEEKVRSTLIISSVVLAVLSFSIWMGIKMFS